jgi:rhamnosyltransferase
MMKEDFWIDYIDYDFSFRLRELGYRIIGVGAARLKHRLGDTSRINIGKRYLSYHVHPAFRRYTIYRNRVRVLRQYGLKFPSFLIFEILSIGKDFLKLICIEDKKLSKFTAIIRGLIDGLLGKGGFKKF